MSEHHIEVVRLGPVIKHDNADTLGITMVHGGYPCIVRLGEFSEGDLAVYIPVDAIVPTDSPRFAFLGEGHGRIRAKRLRGVFSMGLLSKPEDDMNEGDDVAERWGITKYEPPEPGMRRGPGGSFVSSSAIHPPFTAPVYDLEGLRKFGRVLVEGEPVQVTEKIHGANGRFVFHDGALWCGSRNQWKKEDPEDLWWKVAAAEGLAEKLANCPDLIVYGEVYGQVQDLKYGVEHGAKLAVFDAIELKTQRWLDVTELDDLCKSIDLPRVPELYRGPWTPERSDEWAEGQSTLAGHVREGFVVRPLATRYDIRAGRVIFKRAGQGYLLRKGG